MKRKIRRYRRKFTSKGNKTKTSVTSQSEEFKSPTAAMIIDEESIKTSVTSQCKEFKCFGQKFIIQIIFILCGTIIPVLLGLAWENCFCWLKKNPKVYISLQELTTLNPNQNLNLKNVNIFLDGKIQKYKISPNGIYFKFCKKGFHLVGVEITENKEAKSIYKREYEQLRPYIAAIKKGKFNDNILRGFNDWNSTKYKIGDKKRSPQLDTTNTATRSLEHVIDVEDKTYNFRTYCYHKLISDEDFLKGKILFLSFYKSNVDRPEIIFTSAVTNPSIVIFEPTRNIDVYTFADLAKEFKISAQTSFSRLSNNIIFPSDATFSTLSKKYKISFPEFNELMWYEENDNNISVDRAAFADNMANKINSSVLILPFIDEERDGTRYSTLLIRMNPMVDMLVPNIFEIEGVQWNEKNELFKIVDSNEIKIADVLALYVKAYLLYQNYGDEDEIRQLLENFKKQVDKLGGERIYSYIPSVIRPYDYLNQVYDSLKIEDQNREGAFNILEKFWKDEHEYLFEIIQYEYEKEKMDYIFRRTIDYNKQISGKKIKPLKLSGDKYQRLKMNHANLVEELAKTIN